MSSSDWQLIGTAVTLGIAIVGWSRANRAERHAKTANDHAAAANTIAEEAISLARSAEDRADRLEQIATEKRDVAWQHRPVEEHYRGTLSFQNIGSDTAYDVELIVDPIHPAGRRQTETFSSIGPARNIGINLSGLVAEAEQRASHVAPMVLSTGNATVRARVTWRSESGVQSTQEWASLTV